MAEPKEDEELGSENLPAFEDGKEDATIPTEGEVTVPAKGEEKEEEITEEAPKYQFKTDEELDEFIKSRQPAPTAPEPPVTPAKTEEEEDDEFKDLTLFKGYKDPKTGQWVGEVPEDWNDFARRILRNTSAKVVAPKVIEQIRDMSKKDQEELQRIDQEFDKEYDALATQGLVPQRNTPEGVEVNKQITNIGASWGQSSITKAHELWKKIPKDQGGGLDYVSPAKSKVNASKAVAAKIGSSSASSAGKPKAGSIPYNKLHSARGVDDLLEDEDL